MGDSTGDTLTGVAAVIDAVDARLLQMLAADGRASLRSLAEEVGLSSPSVAERINRLTERGIVRRFTVEVDWAALGLPTLVHIALLIDKTRQIDQVVRELRTIDRVEEISIVTGATDLLVRARVNDLSDLRQLLVERIWTIDGIQRVETTLAVETQPMPDFTTALLSQRAAPIRDAASHPVAPTES